jgi:uncharacterized membrane protein YtjA (UPF0391 family)
MRGESILDVGSSLLIAIITGLYGFGGLALADYAFLAARPDVNAAGAILFLFGVVNLLLFVLWSRETANERAILAAGRSRRALGKHSGCR